MSNGSINIMESKSYDIYISFKHFLPNGKATRDSILAFKLFHFLKAHGLSVYFYYDRNTDQESVDYLNIIDQAIYSSKLLLVVGTSQEYLNSEGVQYELKTFSNSKLGNISDKIVTYIEGIQKQGLPYPLRQTFIHDDQPLEVLLDGLKNALKKEELIEQNIQKRIREILQTKSGGNTITSVKNTWLSDSVFYPKHQKRKTRGLHEVNCICIDAKGDNVISGHSDKSIHIWDLHTGRHIEELEGLLHIATQIKLSSDANTLIVSAHKKIYVWNNKTREYLKVLEGHYSAITGMCFSSDNKNVVSTSFGANSMSIAVDEEYPRSETEACAIRIWDLETGKCIKELGDNISDVKCVGWIGNGNSILIGCSPNDLQVWNLISGECVKTLMGHSLWINNVSISKNGAIAVSAGADSALRVWDLEKGECLRIMKGHKRDLKGIVDVSLTQDGKLVVSVGADKTIMVWDIISGDCIVCYDTDSLINTVDVKGRFIIYGTRYGEVGVLEMMGG